MTDRYLIVGLGNPGREYEKTRHNIGFRALDAIAAAYQFPAFKKQGKALVWDGVIGDKKVLLAKPQTYMNLSGEAVRPLLDFYKIPLENLLVISDDMDIPLGTLRIRAKGGAGGQNGLKSIASHLGTQEYPRMRIGIGRPPGRMEPSAYVLQDFGREDFMLLLETLDRIVKSVDTWLRLGLGIMMTRHNGTAEESARNATATQPATQAAPKPAPKTASTSESAKEKVKEAAQPAPSMESTTISNSSAANPDHPQS